MKILVGMPAPDSPGGPLSSEPPFVKALGQKGFDVVAETYVYDDKLKPTRFAQRVNRVLRTALRFRKLVRDDRPSLIFLNSAFDKKTIIRDSVSLFLMRPANLKVFVKLHGSMVEDFENAGFLFRQLIGYLQKKVDAFVYHTREEL